MGQETKLSPEDFDDAVASISSNIGCRCYGAPCDISSVNGKSGGVLISIPSFIGSGSLGRSPILVPGRAAFAHVDAWIPGGVVLITAYFYTAEGLSARNWEILGAIGAFVHSLDIPWTLAVDSNMDLGVIEASGWLESVCGALVFTKEATCHSRGSGSTIDYFVISAVIRTLVKTVKVKTTTANKVHDPVVLTMSGDYVDQYKMIQVTPRTFPRDRPQGPVQCSDHCRWQDLGDYVAIGSVHDNS